MKIALVFSGQPRNICKELYESFYKHILSKYDVDVYGHFWFHTISKQVGQTFAPWVKEEWLQVPVNVQNTFDELYKPKKVVWDSPLLFEEKYNQYTNVRFPKAGYNLFSYYTSIQRSYELIEHPEQYDYILHSRIDLEVLEFPDLSTLPPKVYVSKWHTCHTFERLYEGIDNSIWAAPSSYAKNVFSAVDLLDFLYQKGVLMNDEEMFYGFLSHKNLLEKVVPDQIHYVLRRSV